MFPRIEHLLVGVIVVKVPCTVPCGDRTSGTTCKELLGATVLVGYKIDEDLGLLLTGSRQCTFKQVVFPLIVSDRVHYKMKEDHLTRIFHAGYRE